MLQMWIFILPTFIWFSQCIDNKIWVGAFQLGGHLKQQKMDTSCFWKFTKIPKNDQFSCLPNHCKKKNIAFILYTLYNTDIGMSKLQYLFDNVSICWAMAHLKMSSRWSLWWSSAALLGVKHQTKKQTQNSLSNWTQNSHSRASTKLWKQIWLRILHLNLLMRSLRTGYEVFKL